MHSVTPENVSCAKARPPTACNLFCIKGYFCKLEKEKCDGEPRYVPTCVPIEEGFCHMVTQNASTSPRIFFFPIFFGLSDFNGQCTCYEITTGAIVLLFELVWRIFISISYELLPIYI